MLEVEVEGLADHREVGGDLGEAGDPVDVAPERLGGGLEGVERVGEPGRRLRRLGLDASEVRAHALVGGVGALARPAGGLADVEQPGAEALAEVAGDPPALGEGAAPGGPAGLHRRPQRRAEGGGELHREGAGAVAEVAGGAVHPVEDPDHRAAVLDGDAEHPVDALPAYQPLDQPLGVRSHGDAHAVACQPGADPPGAAGDEHVGGLADADPRGLGAHQLAELTGGAPGEGGGVEQAGDAPGGPGEPDQVLRVHGHGGTRAASHGRKHSAPPRCAGNPPL